MMLLPCRSRARALFRTSKAVSVPSRDMRRASCNSCCVVGDMMALLRSQTAHYTLRNPGFDLQTRNPEGDRFEPVHFLRGVIPKPGAVQPGEGSPFYKSACGCGRSFAPPEKW